MARENSIGLQDIALRAAYGLALSLVAVTVEQAVYPANAWTDSGQSTDTAGTEHGVVFPSMASSDPILQSPSVGDPGAGTSMYEIQFAPLSKLPAAAPTTPDQNIVTAPPVALPTPPQTAIPQQNTVPSLAEPQLVNITPAVKSAVPSPPIPQPHNTSPDSIPALVILPPPLDSSKHQDAPYHMQRPSKLSIVTSPPLPLPSPPEVAVSTPAVPSPEVATTSVPKSPVAPATDAAPALISPSLSIEISPTPAIVETTSPGNLPQPPKEGDPSIVSAPPAPLPEVASSAPPPPPPPSRSKEAPAPTPVPSASKGFETVPNPAARHDSVYNYHAENLKKIHAEMLPEHKAAVAEFIQHYQENKSRYEEIAKKTGLPAPLIAALHWREASGNFNAYLQNGDPLGKPTVHVPAGLLFYNFEDSAVAALNADRFLHDKYALSKDSQDLAAAASFAEHYNGMGYHARGVPSPYVYSGTNIYKSGKYVADGVYDPAAEDRQPGVLVLISAVRDR